jgi:integrase/recombinase XerD
LKNNKHDIIDHYETEIDAFSIMMKDKEYSELTQREYMLDVMRFLGSVYPKPTTNYPNLMSCGI